MLDIDEHSTCRLSIASLPSQTKHATMNRSNNNDTCVQQQTQEVRSQSVKVSDCIVDTNCVKDTRHSVKDTTCRNILHRIPASKTASKTRFQQRIIKKSSAPYYDCQISDSDCHRDAASDAKVLQKNAAQKRVCQRCMRPTSRCSSERMICYCQRNDNAWQRWNLGKCHDESLPSAVRTRDSHPCTCMLPPSPQASLNKEPKNANWLLECDPGLNRWIIHAWCMILWARSAEDFLHLSSELWFLISLCTSERVLG